MTFVVRCSRQCFGSIPGLEFSLSIPHVVILTFSRNAQARITFVCSTEPKMPAAAPKCCSSGLASCPSKRHPLQFDKMLLMSFFVRFLHCLDLLSNPSSFNEFSLSLSLKPNTALQMVKNGCKLLLLVLFIIIIIVLSITSIIIAIIYKNENPMVCLLALWVYKCFFFPKTSSYTLYKKRWIFPYFLCR